MTGEVMGLAAMLMGSSAVVIAVGATKKHRALEDRLRKLEKCEVKK